MPKSGSHLIIQVLEGLTRLGPFVNPGFPPVNRYEDNRKQPEERVLAEVRAMQPGDIRYGYLHATEPWVSALTGPGRATVFVYRDPRDWVISQVMYASEMHPGHMLHEAYSALEMPARIDLAIRGGPAAGLEAVPSLTERYGHYTGWLEVPNVLCLRFEDLIQERDRAMDRILDYLGGFGFRPGMPRAEARAALAVGIAPGRSGTFRKGQPGNWREHFSPENVRCFKERAGDLLVALGYEPDHTWSL